MGTVVRAARGPAGRGAAGRAGCGRLPARAPPTHGARRGSTPPASRPASQPPAAAHQVQDAGGVQVGQPSGNVQGHAPAGWAQQGHRQPGRTARDEQACVGGAWGTEQPPPGPAARWLVRAAHPAAPTHLPRFSQASRRAPLVRLRSPIAAVGRRGKVVRQAGGRLGGGQHEAAAAAASASASASASAERRRQQWQREAAAAAAPAAAPAPAAPASRICPPSHPTPGPPQRSTPGPACRGCRTAPPP